LSFRGQFEHTLDAKDRLTVPSKFRAALADGVVLLKGLHPSVWVFSPEGYESFTQRFLGQTNPLGSKGRDMRLYFAGNSFDDSLDSAGRIRVPKKLLEHASLSEGPCAIVGAEGWFEVWSPESWSAHEQRIDAQIVDVAENLAEGS
jgi:transcriptional regulator MraZ